MTGDAARRDEQCYYWILGRVDDVMNVSGRPLSTMEIESAPVRIRGGGSRRGGQAARDHPPGRGLFRNS